MAIMQEIGYLRYTLAKTKDYGGVMQSTRDRILERLDRLPEMMLDEILQFIDSLSGGLPRPQGIPGKLLLYLAGSIPSEDAR